MFNSEYRHQVAWPAVMLFLVYLLINIITSESFYLGATIVAALIVEVFAYTSCVFFVLKKDKPRNYIWLNYVLWTLFFTAGTVAEYIDKIF